MHAPSETAHPTPALARRAVIDIGTNSVKLLVGDVTASGVVPVFEAGVQTRLGRGFYATYSLQSEPIRETIQAVRCYLKVARSHHAVAVRLVATSAVREARNQEFFVQQLEQTSGCSLEIIQGDQEAAWGFQGVLTNPELADKPLLVLDVGGGSTEYVLGMGRTAKHHGSYPMGSVRLLESIAPPESPSPQDLARAREAVAACYRTQILPDIESALLRIQPALAIGIGGTTAILARIQLETELFDRQLIEATTFDPDQLTQLVERLWRLPLAERCKLPGLPPERADVILTGAVIYEQLIRETQLPRLGVSTRGLRFAVLTDTTPGCWTYFEKIEGRAFVSITP